jgi:hypothetical protein
MTENQRRIARARLLRREGKTYDEIRAAVGPVSDDRLQTWLVGIPRPPQTRLSRPLTELRSECRRLRLQGLSYSEIAAATGASAGSLSLWLRDLKDAPAVRAAKRRHSASGPHAAGRRTSEQALRRQRECEAAGADMVSSLTARELFLAGLALYWAEGTKDKPWRRNGRVVLINGDPGVLTVFLSWLDLMGIPEEDRHYRLSIHERSDVDVQENWWAERLRIPVASFARATLKRHKPTTLRRNTGEDYHGCLVISVLRSRKLYDLIAGAWAAVTAAAEAIECGKIQLQDVTADQRNLLFDPSRVVQLAVTSGFGPEDWGSSPCPGAEDLRSNPPRR